MIQLEGVCKAYRVNDVDVRALDDVDLTIDQGEPVAIMDPLLSRASAAVNVELSLLYAHAEAFHVGSDASDRLPQARVRQQQ